MNPTVRDCAITPFVQPLPVVAALKSNRAPALSQGGRLEFQSRDHRESVGADSSYSLVREGMTIRTIRKDSNK